MSTQLQWTGIYAVDRYKNAIKSVKMRGTQEDETLIFQKNMYKMRTFINPLEQNNDHTQKIHKIQFRSFFEMPLFKTL